MSDIRDTNFDGAPRFIEEPIPQASFVDSGGLNDFHTNSDDIAEGNGRSQLLAGLVVALLVGVAGAYAWSSYSASQPKVADSSLPTPSAPTHTAAMTPPPPIPSTAPEATPPTDTNLAPTAPDVVKPALATKQAMMRAKPNVARATEPAPKSNDTAAPVEQQAVTQPAVTPQNQAANTPSTVPEAVSPTPPVSAVAGNPALNQELAAPAAAPQADETQAGQPQTVVPPATPAQPSASPDVTAAPAPATPDTAPAQ